MEAYQEDIIRLAIAQSKNDRVGVQTKILLEIGAEALIHESMVVNYNQQPDQFKPMQASSVDKVKLLEHLDAMASKKNKPKKEAQATS